MLIHSFPKSILNPQYSNMFSYAELLIDIFVSNIIKKHSNCSLFAISHFRENSITLVKFPLFLNIDKHLLLKKLINSSICIIDCFLTKCSILLLISSAIMIEMQEA